MIEGRPITGWRRLWPPVGFRQGAEEAVIMGYQVCFLATGLTAIWALIYAVQTFGLSFLDPGLYLVCGLGVRRRSRVMATLGLLLSAGTFVYSVVGPGPGITHAFVVLGCLNGVRGTYALARLGPVPPAAMAPEPTTPS